MSIDKSSKKKTIIFSLITLLGIGVVAISTVNKDLVVLSANQNNNPYLNTITIDSSSLTNGSGNCTVGGNTFSYSGISVNGNTFTLSTNASIEYVPQSGNNSDVLVGAGFTSLTLKASSNYSGRISVNGNGLNKTIANNEIVNIDVNSNDFNISVLDSSLSLYQLTLTYKCQTNAIEIDGAANDYIYSSEVMSKPYYINRDDNYRTTVYGVKRSEGLYIYAEQHVKTIKHNSDEWWQNDNIEFRFSKSSAVFDNLELNHSQHYVSMAGQHTFTSFAHSDFSGNESTGYDCTYEAFMSWSKLGISFSDTLIFACGVNYDVGFVRGSGYSDPSSDMYKFKIFSIEENGISYPFKGEELINSPVFAEWDGIEGEGHNWNSGVYSRTVSSYDNWAFYLKLHTKVKESKRDDIASGFVGDIYSPNWAYGGWSFRQDWYSFAPWNNGSSINQRDISQIASDADDWSTVNLPIVRQAMWEMDVELIIRNNASTGTLSIHGIYHLDLETYGNKTITVNLVTSNFGYDGDMIVSLGYYNSEFTLYSCTRITNVESSDMRARGTYQTNVNYIGDPFIYYDSTSDYYYMYGTADHDGSVVVECFRGKTLNSFSKISDALQSSNVLGNAPYWAPEVIKYNGDYYMFYTGDDSGHKRIYVAKSDYPEGPYIKIPSSGPIVDEVAIDASPFIDPVSGNVYLTYSKDCSENIVDGHPTSQIYIIQLNSSDLSKTIGTAKLIATPYLPWETINCPEANGFLWNEGPYLLYDNGTYYLTYSCQMFANENYSVGLATSSSVMGTYSKYEAGPILTKISGVTSGPGHCAFFKDRNNYLICVYHIHMSVNNPSGGRKAAFSKASFSDGRLVIDYNH